MKSQVVVAALLLGSALLTAAPSEIVVDYPVRGSLFPPDFSAPTFLWRDNSAAVTWKVEISFKDGYSPLRCKAAGERFSLGVIDTRAVGAPDEMPKLTPEQAASRTWTPDAASWDLIKKHSVKRPATVAVIGLDEQDHAVSRGETVISTSKDPVGAPIFYRDVPLSKSETKKGVIKPLADHAVPLIAWRIRNVSEPQSRLLMTGLHTCANCHSFSRDGKTLGMDVDGPANDKGLYTLVPVGKRITVRDQDVIQWSDQRGKLGGRLRVAFMSQVSPTGQYVITTINDPGPDNRDRMRDVANNYYVVNFRDYRFLQVFYPTRGILAWYSRETQKLQPLPGADDPQYVHANAVWSPDGKYLAFVRARARDAYPPGVPLAQHALDPNETQIQFDLYRIPFNNGKGGRAERIAGASENGMSNSFPKISPDGKWIVFVQSRNAQLMRPDSQLYIVPAKGGQARRMNCNTSLMNSWHSFSPNGKWMVFASKSRSPFTQMYLTHIDKKGQDTPPVLIENATAANRAVNLPEFINIPPDELTEMEAPVTEFYRAYNTALDLGQRKRFGEAVAAWKKALELNSRDPRVHNYLGNALTDDGHPSEAIPFYQSATALDPDYAEAYTNMGLALASLGRQEEAITVFEKALSLSPNDYRALTNLGGAKAEQGKTAEAIEYCERAIAIQPDHPQAHNNLAVALVRAGRMDEAIPHFEKAALGDPDAYMVQFNLASLLARRGRVEEALPHLEKAAEAQDAVIVASVAAIYAAAGRYEAALRTARRAQETAREHHQEDLANAIGAKIAELEATMRGAGG